MEKQFASSKKIQSAFEGFELASLYTDANTDEERANLKTQTDRFGSSVIPVYFIIDPATGKVVAEHTGACSVDDFLGFLGKAH
jgi:hypothetical protein